MKNNPLFAHLDTSFVDLDAMVRYLRRRNFVGMVLLAFNGYTGEITLTPEHRLRVRERDTVSGQHLDGEIAFNAIMKRSKTPGGVISVQQTPIEADGQKASDASDLRPASFESGAASHDGPKDRGLLEMRARNVENEILNGGTIRGINGLHNEMRTVESSHNGSAASTNGDRDLLADLTCELLQTIEKALGRANLDFSAALEKACSDVTDEFPFMSPSQRMFKYNSGILFINGQLDRAAFVDALGTALLRIFSRLGESIRFGKVYRFAVQRVQALLQDRKSDFDSVGLTAGLERVIAV